MKKLIILKYIFLYIILSFVTTMIFVICKSVDKYLDGPFLAILQISILLYCWISAYIEDEKQK